jgi:hypothetical protein
VALPHLGLEGQISGHVKRHAGRLAVGVAEAELLAADKARVARNVVLGARARTKVAGVAERICVGTSGAAKGKITRSSLVLNRRRSLRAGVGSDAAVGAVRTLVPQVFAARRRLWKVIAEALCCGNGGRRLGSSVRRRSSGGSGGGLSLRETADSLVEGSISSLVSIGNVALLAILESEETKNAQTV